MNGSSVSVLATPPRQEEAGKAKKFMKSKAVTKANIFILVKTDHDFYFA